MADGLFLCACGQQFLQAKDIRDHALTNVDVQHPVNFAADPMPRAPAARKKMQSVIRKKHSEHAGQLATHHTEYGKLSIQQKRYQAGPQTY